MQTAFVNVEIRRPYAVYVNGTLAIKTMTMKKALLIARRFSGNVTIVKEVI